MCFFLTGLTRRCLGQPCANRCYVSIDMFGIEIGGFITSYRSFFTKRDMTILRNKYVLTLLLFFIWFAFFDSNNLISQVRLSQEKTELYQKKDFYEVRILEVRSAKSELLTNKETLEKFAREKYWMKKANEDLFIIVDADKELD